MITTKLYVPLEYIYQFGFLKIIGTKRDSDHSQVGAFNQESCGIDFLYKRENAAPAQHVFKVVCPENKGLPVIHVWIILDAIIIGLDTINDFTKF